VHGFDERFPRAYREDADLALRVEAAGWQLVRGTRTTVHPVRPADPRVSVRVQRGNADDALMRRLHGPRWRERAHTGRGRLPWHVATCALAGLAALGAAGRLRRPAVVGLAGWALLTADFAWRRISPGPKDSSEVARMLWTSAAIPVVAVWHRLRGSWLHRRAVPWPPTPRAVLFDRDGTLVHDVPYNGEPAKVVPVPGAQESVRRLRAKGLAVGVVSNQSGVARGLLTTEQVTSVNARVNAAVGPFDTWQVCPHGPADGCACRKPRPGMVQAAARDLGVRPEDCVVVGDIGADVLAARAAGARSVLVPTEATLPDEVADAPLVASDLAGAVDLILGTRRG
jgi:histidinol-phosphate phosphatase family protein